MMEKANSVYLQREFQCSAQRLFEWMTQAELLAQWFGPKNCKVTEARMDLRVGGDYFIRLERENGSGFSIRGKYLEISKPKSVHFSFAYEGLNGAPPESVVKITIEQLDERRSSLSLIQEFDSRPADMEKRTLAWEHMLLLVSELTKA